MLNTALFILAALVVLAVIVKVVATPARRISDAGSDPRSLSRGPHQSRSFPPTSAAATAVPVAEPVLDLLETSDTPRGPLEPPAADAYTANDSLLSAAERTFLDALEKAIPPNTRVFVQVAFSALISPRKGSPTWQRDRNRIAQKIADFVLCDQWAKPLAVIELDDVSHSKSRRADRDELLQTILAGAGLRLVRLPARGNYDVATIRETLSLLPFQS